MNRLNFRHFTKRIYSIIFLFFGLILIGTVGLILKLHNPNFLITQNKTNTYQAIEIINTADIKNGIHIPTGFKEGKGLENVIISCTPCHSAKLVTQNRATKEGWTGIIRWMQETQNLWDLGENENLIVDYLSTHYAPEKQGRRTELKHIEWYELKD